MRHLPIAIALCASLLSPASAETVPRGSAHDARVRVATWVDGQVYRIETALTHVTTVELGDGETIRSIIAGDTEGFLFDGVPGARAFAIKPTAGGVRTNVVVYTDRRSYYFDVVEAGGIPHYAVRFAYPEEPVPQAIASGAPTFAYGASGDAEFRPGSVHDDGTFTYFAFPPNVPVPAIFRTDRLGRERAVNALAAGPGVIRVSGVSPRWVLRLGDEVVCIQAAVPAMPMQRPST